MENVTKLHHVPIDNRVRDRQKRKCYPGRGVAVIGNIAVRTRENTAYFPFDERANAVK